MERVSVDITAAGVARVTLARPDKMNALDDAMFEAINATIARLQKESGLRAVVLHGDGRAFCAGLDKSSLSGLAGEGSSSINNLEPRTHGLANRWQHVAWGWRQVPVPVIAAVHGVAFGGGLQIALGADVRIVHPDTQLSVMEIRWGLVPDMAGCVLMLELMRADVVRDLVYTGRVVKGDEAVALGLATRVAADPLDEAMKLAAQIAASSPDAIRAAKRLLNAASPVDAQRVLQAEAMEQQKLVGSPNQREAVLAGMQGRAAMYR
ncbi:crotonase/enoyl-CoA hydratase family protein [Ramlibacter sp. PS4R-6]|uniref:crotonase/enoyl-CoA hydratase family protein n=1 Tax=Ramlibacter sp. PS4R-6 TaxID=3133438 RepID=UPI0030AE1EC4